MTLYNTVIGSTHCIYVNFVRTQAFLQSFWTSVIVTYYTNESRKQLLYETGSGMWSIIGWGWVIIGIIHYLLFRYVLVRWMDSSMKKDSERLPGDLPSIRDECITSPEMISEQKLESEPSNIDNDSHTSAKLENISIDGSVTHGTLATETSGDALSTLVEGHSTVKTAVDIPADEQNTKSKPLPTVPRPSVSSTARPSITGTSCRPSITGTTSRPSLPSIGRPSLPYSIGRPSQFNTERPSLHSVERPSIATTGRIIQIATAFKFEAVYDADQKIKLFGPRPLPDGIDDPISIYLAAQEDFKLATPLQAVSMSIEVEDAV
ncbi:hypothetical protein BC833DRAFT_162778 [Globomyces pollinis-pini]|nr:hypothetical protein BC833DRAFT_162778 [Globomyces pollinis-pini]